MTEYCAFTVKQLGAKDTVPSDYMPVFSHWEKFGFKVQKVYYEPDSLGKCHCHGTLNLPHSFFRKKLSVMGFHMHFVPIFDQKGWDKYCTKHNCNQPNQLKVTIVNPHMYV